MLVEMRPFTAAARSRAAPSKARDFQACQYRQIKAARASLPGARPVCRQPGEPSGCLRRSIGPGWCRRSQQIASTMRGAAPISVSAAPQSMKPAAR
jgi:hypothetical protein